MSVEALGDAIFPYIRQVYTEKRETWNSVDAEEKDWQRKFQPVHFSQLSVSEALWVIWK